MNITPKINDPKATKRGRPILAPTWPDGEFTVDMAVKHTRLCRVSVYSKLKEAVKLKSVCIYSKIPGKGRPRFVYKKLNAAPASPLAEFVDDVGDIAPSS